MTPQRRVSALGQNLFFVVKVIGQQPLPLAKLIGTRSPEKVPKGHVVVKLQLVLIDGRPEVVDVKIGTPIKFPRSLDPVPIDSGVLRAIRIGELRELALAYFADELRRLASRHPKVPGLSRRLPRAEKIAKQTRRGPADEGLDRYIQVARVYTEAVLAGKPPTKSVQEQCKLDSYDKAKRLVNRARHEYGLLPKTEPGRAGGIGGSEDTKGRKQ